MTGLVDIALSTRITPPLERRPSPPTSLAGFTTTLEPKTSTRQNRTASVTSPPIPIVQETPPPPSIVELGQDIDLLSSSESGSERLLASELGAAADGGSEAAPPVPEAEALPPRRPAGISRTVQAPAEKLFPMTESRPPYIPQIPMPEAVQRGSRPGISSVVGQCLSFTSQLDRRAWLEVLDPKHRYAKNLRAYFKAWDLMGKPGGDFLEWLDTDTFELESCPRHVLEADTVYYCTEVSEREEFALDIFDNRIVHRHSRQPVHTGDGGYIFVVRDATMYAREKKTDPPRFHHSSFFAGESVEVAGMIQVDQGTLKCVFPHSGHYRPKDRHVLHLLQFFKRQNMDLSTIEVDAQHTMKVARLLAREGNRVKKKDSPHLMRGDTLLHFLNLKVSTLNTPLFDELRSLSVLKRHHDRACPLRGACPSAAFMSSSHDELEPHLVAQRGSPSSLHAMLLRNDNAKRMVNVPSAFSLSLQEGNCITDDETDMARAEDFDVFQIQELSSSPPVYCSCLDLAASNTQIDHVHRDAF